MPIYAIHCPRCGAEGDVFRSVAERDADLPECCGARTERKVCAPFVAPDYAAYQAVAIDKKTGRMPVIHGKREHREFLARNGYRVMEEEPQLRTEVRGDFNVRRELTDVTRKVLADPRQHR